MHSRKIEVLFYAISTVFVFSQVYSEKDVTYFVLQ